jgi:hypothetical protein
MVHQWMRRDTYEGVDTYTGVVNAHVLGEHAGRFVRRLVQPRGVPPAPQLEGRGAGGGHLRGADYMDGSSTTMALL